MYHVSHHLQSPAEEHTQLILDGSKVQWHQDRIAAWERGERFAPITIDMALTRACQASCVFCYALMQENERQTITIPVMERFLTDCAKIGVKGISLVSDGESTLSPAYAFSIRRGYELGISMASGTNGILVKKSIAEQILPALTYIRININSATAEGNRKIMGYKPEWHHQVIQNIKDMVAIKQRDNLAVTIGMQMVLMPVYGEEIIPLAQLAIDLGVDYFVIKHCSDDEHGTLGVEYEKYESLFSVLEQAEAMSNARTQISAKWKKIRAGNVRSYERCYGPPFIIQISGSGLVAPCGMLFNERYRKFHIGNICQDSFAELVQSDRYWEVMGYLASDRFNAQRMCGSLCLQHLTNVALDEHRKGNLQLIMSQGEEPSHVDFI